MYAVIKSGKKGIIPPHPHVLSWMDSGSDLANQDAPSLDLLSAVPLHAQALPCAITAIP